MKLSDAIALGRTLKSPRAYTLGIGEDGGCAIGMGLAAVDEHGSWPAVMTRWPWLTNQRELPCGCNEGVGCSASAIVHVFDFHVYEKCDWTLDQLIDWVRSVEPAEAEAPESVQVEQGVEVRQ